MGIDIVEIRYWIANGQITSIFDRVLCPPYNNGGGISISHFYTAPHDSGEVLQFHVECPCVCPSVVIRTSVNRFWMIT